MQTDQTNHVNMFKTTDAFLNDNNSIWSSMAPFVAAKQAFVASVAMIDAAVAKQETPTGATADRGAARDALEDIAFLMSQALFALGHTSGDHDLVARASLRSSDFERFPDDELSTRAGRIVADANARQAQLATLNVTQANIDELTQALNRFNDARVSPRTAIAERKAQTESIPVLIRGTTDILQSRVDPLVNLFSRTHPHFVAGYKAARVIVDRAATRSAKKAGPGTGNQ